MKFSDSFSSKFLKNPEIPGNVAAENCNMLLRYKIIKAINSIEYK